MRDVKTTRFETYKEVAIAEKSVVKQCVSCVGSMLVCTVSEGSRISGSELGRYLWQQRSWLFSQKGTADLCFAFINGQ